MTAYTTIRWMACVAVLGGSLLSGASAQAACAFRVDVLAIGQGDATFIQTPDCVTALIDGGDAGSGKVIRSHLTSLGVTSLNTVVVTHYHQDHLAGVLELGQGTPVPVTQVWDRGGSYDSDAFRQYSSIYAGKRKTPTLGQTIALGSKVALKVLAVNGNGTGATDENSLGIGLKLTYGELDILLAGDLTGTSSGGTKDVEGLLAPSAGPVEIYHVNHHGGEESSNDTLVQVLRPDVSLISVGWDNSYGHPTQAVLDRLDRVGSDVWMTEDPAQQKELGTITVTSADGQTYSVKQGAQSVTYASRLDGTQPVRTPVALTVLQGTQPSTDLTKAQKDDANRWELSSASKSSVYATDLKVSFDLSNAVPTELTLVANQRYSTSRTQTVSVLNPSTGAWEALGTTTVSSSDQTNSFVVYEPWKFRSSTGRVEFRMTGQGRSSTYKHYADALFAVWEP